MAMSFAITLRNLRHAVKAYAVFLALQSSKELHALLQVDRRQGG